MAADLARVRKSIRAALDSSGRTPDECASLHAMARELAEKHGLLEEFFPDKTSVHESTSEVSRRAEEYLRAVAAEARAQREMLRREAHARMERMHARQARELAATRREMERARKHREASVNFLGWLASHAGSQIILALVLGSVWLRGDGPLATLSLMLFMAAGWFVHLPQISKYAAQIRLSTPH